MKITESLAQKDKDCGFYFGKGDLGVCRAFITHLMSGENSMNITLTLSTTNPEKEGFRKIVRDDWNYVYFDGKSYPICRNERDVLEDAGIKINDSFWVKGENVK